jgi:transcriptional regulator with XRE-family HTH domain
MPNDPASDAPRAPSLGSQIATWRRREGWTKARLAEHMGVTPSAVRCWETGKTFPTPDLAARLAELLAIPVDTIEALRPWPRGAAKNAADGAGPDRAGLAKLMIAYRRRHRLTQKALAGLLAVSSTSVADWEQGRKFPEWYSLVRLADLFGLSAEDIKRLRPTHGTEAALRLLAPASASGLPEAGHRSLAWLLLAWRHRQEVTQAELGERCGATQAAVSLWESGREFPQGRTLLRMAGVLGLSADTVERLRPPADYAAETPFKLAGSRRRIRLPPGDDRSLTTLIRGYRHDHKLSQEGFGRLCGVARDVVSAWERGAMPRPAKLPRLSSVLGIGLDRLKRLAMSDQRRVAAKILSVMADGQAHHVAFIERHVEAPHLAGRLGDLVEQGVLRRVSRGVYQLAQIGIGETRAARQSG